MIKQHTHATGFLQLVSEAKKRVKEITVDELAKKQQQRHPFYLIDVRELSEFQQGTIPQAMHLSKGIIERDIETSIPDLTADIVVYCSGGFRSCLVVDNLQKMGYQHVASLHGGFKAWVQASYRTFKNS